jgi:aspartate aminotransferase/aminotransferase
MMAKAMAIPGVARLDVGEPQFDTPGHIVDAAFAAARAGFTKYTASAGLISTREAIARSVSQDVPTSVSADNIVVTVGAVGALSSAVRAVVDAGDDVLIPNPGWPNYIAMVRCAGAEPRPYALHSDNGFVPTSHDLEGALTPRAKAILINTPANPTGAVFPQKVMEMVLNFAQAHDLYVISDEVYGKIVFGRELPHTSAWGLGHDERVIVANSLSKTYSMTGWRIGWSLAAPDMTVQIAKLQEAYVSCCSSIAQKAAEAALSGDQACVHAACGAYHRNLEIAEAALDSQGIGHARSAGTFFLWVDVGCHDSWSFADRFLQERKVAVAPGDAFGSQGHGRVRLSLASSVEQVEYGVQQLAEFCASEPRA